MSATCAVHSEVAATATCGRCGKFICDPCGRWASQQRWCVDCFKRFDPKPSKEAKRALLLSTLGFLFIVPGLVGFVLARRELKRIATGQSLESSRDTAELARNLGLVSFVMLALIIVWAIRTFMP